MAENNKNNFSRGKSGKKDSFVKPGDENIVSNKGFLISLPKFRKGPANPLLESEKNKAEAKNAENRKNVEKAERKADNGKDFRKKDNFDGKNKHFDKKDSRNKGSKGNIREENKPDFKNQNDRTKQYDNSRSFEKGERQENTKDFRNDRRNRNDKQRRRNDKKHREQDLRNVNFMHEQIAAENEKNGTKQFSKFDREARRPKHKKEKFVPTAPENASENEPLLQPIVDRAGIISGGTKTPLYRSSQTFRTSQSNLDVTGDEPRYVDRDRPLSEQTAEQSKPKTYKVEIEEGKESVEVIGVRFRKAGKVYYFDPSGKKVSKDTAVIVETARGVEYGICAIENRRVSIDDIVPPLKPIIRIATTSDNERYESNKQLEESAAKIFKTKVRELGLEMSLVYVEYTFDNGKLLFYFTADGRVDFRELIKELASAFKTRIELRQIGVRDEAKIVGGLGICGRPVCCKSFLGEFSQVSIKMAKDQNLFINSSKISGTCGRFMCCIRYEDEVYQKEYEKTPKVDAIVETPEGKGVVVESNALKGTVKVLLDEKEESVAKAFNSEEVKILGYLRRENEKEEIPEDVILDEEN